MAQTSYSREGVGLRPRWCGDPAGLVINTAFVFATTQHTVEVQAYLTGFRYLVLGLFQVSGRKETLRYPNLPEAAGFEV